MSESHILKLFTAMTLGDTSVKLTEAAPSEDASRKLNKEKKREKNFCGVKKSSNKKKPKKKMKQHGMEEWRKFCEFQKRRKQSHDGSYYGVKKSVSGSMFFAEIAYPDGRLVCLGTYKRPKLAAIAYDRVAFKLYGSEAMLNFPHYVRPKPVMMVMTPPPSSSGNN